MKEAVYAISATAMLASVPAHAQLTRADPVAAVAAAERAADAADRAASEAEKAWLNAREAARSAREAATQARHALGTPSSASPTPLPITTAVESRSADENLREPRYTPAPTGRVAELPYRSEQRAFATGVNASVANGPNGSPLKASGAPDFQLIASSKDKVASISLSVDVTGEPRGGTLSADQLTITASGKLNDEGDSEIANLDGLSNGAEIKLAYTHYSSGVRLTGLEKDPVRVARERCLANPGTDATSCDPYEYATGVSSFVAKYYPSGLRPLLDEVLPGPVWFYGVNFTGNQATFKYLDRTSFSLMKKPRFGYGGGLFGGVLLNNGLTAITGSFDYRRRFREKDPVTLCQPVPGTAQTQCITAADGLSDASTQAVLGLELRHAFPADIGKFSTFAIAPRLSADVENDAWSIDFPLYFAGDGTGKLRGGVRGSYLNQPAKTGGREDEFTLGLFVGVPFSLFQP